MRPPTAISTDADLNLFDAVRIAATPEAAGMGVLTVLNNEIHCAREVYKANTLRVETFKANEPGLPGLCRLRPPGRLLPASRPQDTHTETPFRVDGMSDLPRVDIVHAYAGADGMLIDAVRAHGSAGLVLAGFGAGTFPPAVISAAEAAVAGGMPVVLASRSIAGRVVMTPRKDEQGFIVSDNLMPQKARLLLMLGLTVTSDRGALQEMFYEY